MEKRKQIEFIQEEFKSSSRFVKFITDLFRQFGFDDLHLYPDQIETDGIVLYRQDTLEGEQLWTACVTRVGNIGGSIGTSPNNRTSQLIDRVGYLLNKDFFIDQKVKVKVDRVLIISNGIISKNSQIKIKSEYSDAVLYFWDIEKLQEVISKHWPQYFETKEPILKEYCQALRNNLGDISKELQVLYYNKQTKKLWDIFINLQLIETKIVASTTTLSSIVSTNEQSKKDIYKEENTIPIKKLIKQKFKIEDILEIGKDVVIEGDFGSGKTTILKRIAYEIIDTGAKCEGFKFPVFLLARNLSNHDFNLVKHIEFEIKKITQGKGIDQIQFLESGRMIILIDGLDDIIDGEKDKFLESLNSFKNIYPRVQIILTTRPIIILEKEKLFENFRKFEILPLDIRQISELIEKWYPTDIKQKNKLVNVLKKTALIISIPKTPLAITLLSIIFEDDKVDEIPANITELYNKFTEIFSGKWDREKGISSQDKYGIRSHLTNQIAFQMHFDRKIELTREELLGFVDNYRVAKRYDDITTEALVDDLLNRNPLIIHQNDRYRFLHLSFQEYYGSRGIVQTNEMVQDHHNYLVKNYLDPWWSNLILFYVGNIKDCPQFLIDISEKSVPETLDQRFLKIDNTGKLIQAAISTDNSPKVKALTKILKTVDYFKEAIINELKNDENFNLHFRRIGLSELYIIIFIKQLFISTYKSKYLKPVMLDIFDASEFSKMSDLSKYLLSNTLTELTNDPKFVLDFISSKNTELEWRYLGLMDLDNSKIKFDKDQKKIIGAVKRKIYRGKKYIVARFRKLKEIPKLKDKIDKEDILKH